MIQYFSLKLPPVANWQIHSDMTDDEREETLKRLQKLKQHPRRTENVFYLALVKDESKKLLGKVKAKTAHGDIWLDKF